jgi:F-type H+-transporting ATPase subunit epsilon
MQETTINLKIVTPAGVVYENNEVKSITVPTVAGIITIYANHMDLLSLLTPGEINIEKGDHVVDLAVSAGVIQIMQPNTVKIMAETAERAEEIDTERAEAARKRAEEYLRSQENIADVEFAALQSKIQKELARIDLGRRYRQRRNIPQ